MHFPDLAAAHRFFSADCFNRTWDLLDLERRTPEQDEQLLLLAHASLWHWTQREDLTSRTHSIGLWMLSRVHAVLGRGEEAVRQAAACLSVSAEEPPFYLAYAHEAMARAAAVAGDVDAKSRHLESAWRLAAQIADTGEREMLEKDLGSLG